VTEVASRPALIHTHRIGDIDRSVAFWALGFDGRSNAHPRQGDQRLLGLPDGGATLS
jgi:hypothetical protein